MNYVVLAKIIIIWNFEIYSEFKLLSERNEILKIKICRMRKH